MSELSKALGAESTIESDGIVYRVGGITLEVMSKWEDLLAGDTLDRMLKILGKHKDGEDKAIQAVAKLSAAGEFDYFGEASQNRLRTMKGQQDLVFLRVKQHHPTIEKKIIQDFVEKHWAELYRTVLAELIAMEQSLPNAPAPTTGATNESAGEASLPKSATSSDVSQASAASAA